MLRTTWNLHLIPLMILLMMHVLFHASSNIRGLHPSLPPRVRSLRNGINSSSCLVVEICDLVELVVFLKLRFDSLVLLLRRALVPQKLRVSWSNLIRRLFVVVIKRFSTFNRIAVEHGCLLISIE